MYDDVSLLIDGVWGPASAGRFLTVLNPATGEPAGRVAHAERADLDRALEAAERGFNVWRKVNAFERSKVMRKAANLLRERADRIAGLMTIEQGKPTAEAKGETLAGADVIDWFAEEARRAYGRVIPARADGVYQLVVKEPVGGAHRDHDQAAELVGVALARQLGEVRASDINELMERRYQKFRKIGAFS